MRILHIINTLAIGGAQSVLLQLLEGWQETEDQQMVISLMKREQLSGRVEALGIPLEHINISQGRISPTHVLHLIKIIRVYQPDIVQTWLYHADLIGGLAARIASRAHVIWGVHHTTLDKNSTKRSTWRVVKFLARLSGTIPSSIICCSNSAYETHLRLGYQKEKMSVIVNGIDTERFRPNSAAPKKLRDELGISDEKALIGFFARFNPQKDHETFFQAAGILARKFPNVDFVLAGDGIDENNRQFQKWISQHELKTRVHLLGARLDMPELCSGVDLLTLSSSYGEALPMVIGEAMACGTPCVATDIGDIRTLIADTGIVVAPKKTRDLADAWGKVLGMSEKSYNILSKHSRERIIEYYSVGSMIWKYASLYQAVAL